MLVIVVSGAVGNYMINGRDKGGDKEKRLIKIFAR